MRLKPVFVRRLEKKDIEFAHRMATVEQWNDRKNDVARMFDFEPKGCFIAEVNGEPAGHIFSIVYGTLGWIGLLIVSPDQRRKGIGTALMKEAIDYLLENGVETIKLDAIPEIADLYRKFGFVDEYDSLRFVGTNQDVHPFNDDAAKPVEQEKVPEIAEFDATYFGADRIRVLSRLFNENPEFSFVSHVGSSMVGYITCRRAEKGYKLGPWTCDPKKLPAAEALFTTCLNKLEVDAKVYVGVPSPNTSAIDLLTNHGFRQYSKSIRMRLGKKLESENPNGLFAIAGPMKG